MCGIAGFVGAGTAADLSAMAAAIAHRGPDGDGVLIDDEARVFLAHRRLAILDIAGGVQPMASADGAVTVVFNGEIYNHRLLRADLEARGHRFRSDHSDTEVLVHGWTEWGEDLPLRLNGMFAFALWDRRRNVLFLARDRFGKKPLFVADGPDGFVFGSELRAVVAHPSVPTAVDRLGLKKFFAYGFFPAPFTLYRAVRKLPAGHRMTVRLADGSVRTDAWFRFRVQPDETLAARPIESLAEELRALLAEAVRRRLESDVPLGVLLSGGIDSSAVVAMMARHIPRERIATFAMGFAEPSYDERGFAATMAAHVGSRHHVDVCDLDQARDSLPGLLGQMDEPLGDPSLLPTWMLCRFARSHVTVALGGDGGDELFAGYDPLLALGPTRLWRAVVPRAADPLVARLAELVLPRSDRNMSLDFKVRRWLRGAKEPAGAWIPAWMGPLDAAGISRLFGETTTTEELYSEALAAWETCDSTDPLDRALEYFTRFYLQDTILAKADRASMLNGLEVRSPFLDNDVADFAARLPREVKLHRGNRKRLLKLALSKDVPHALLHRRKKGFGIPLSAWLRSLPPPVPGRLPDLDEAWLADRWDQHRRQQADERSVLWCWMALAHHARPPDPSGRHP